eukprot:6458049-Amphidinium_carterae.1
MLPTAAKGGQSIHRNALSVVGPMWATLGLTIGSCLCSFIVLFQSVVGDGFVDVPGKEVDVVEDGQSPTLERRNDVDQHIQMSRWLVASLCYHAIFP